ncbi:thioredoxin family protein [Nocardioides pakistanensis]
MTAVIATDTDFAAATATGKPVLVDFYATWCGPCRKVAPIVDQIAAEHPEFTVVKVDIDQAAKTTLDFHVMGVPTLVVLDADGQRVREFNGPAPKNTLVEALRAA